MQTKTLEVAVNAAASPQQVWPLLAEVETWSSWAGFDEAVLELPGADHPQGIGAVRRFRAGRIRNVEQVVEFVPLRMLSYEVLSSDIPMRDYHADVTLEPGTDGGTTITWRARFSARWPLAPIVTRRLQQVLADTARRLADAALDCEAPS